MNFLGFLAFYLFLVFPKDVIRNLLRNKSDIIRAKWKAIAWNLNHIFEKQQIVSPKNVTITALLPLSKSFHFKANVE